MTRGGIHIGTRKYMTARNNARRHAEARGYAQRCGKTRLNTGLYEAACGSAPMVDELRQVTPSRAKPRAGVSKNLEAHGGV